MVEQRPATVVIATRDRPEGLRRCLAALAEGDVLPAQVVVVDDGSVPPVPGTGHPLGIDIVRLDGAGPGAARNAGVSRAIHPIILFTDDDTVPATTWVGAAVDYLERQPMAIGVEGPVDTPRFDPLFEFSIHADAPGHHWTCNIGYRAEVLRRLGGFAAREFPFAHCEDRDLGLRAEALGSIGYVPAMRILHTPRAVSSRQVARRGRYAASELLLAARHPGVAIPRSRLPSRWRPPIGVAKRWLRMLGQRPKAAIGSPRRVGFFVVASLGETVQAIGAVIRYRGPLEPRAAFRRHH